MQRQQHLSSRLAHRAIDAAGSKERRLSIGALGGVEGQDRTVEVWVTLKPGASSCQISTGSEHAFPAQ